MNIVFSELIAAEVNYYIYLIQTILRGNMSNMFFIFLYLDPGHKHFV